MKTLALAALLAASSAMAWEPLEEVNKDHWIAFEMVAGVLTSKGDGLYVSWLPRADCVARLSIVIKTSYDKELVVPERDLTDLKITLRVGPQEWRAKRGSMWQRNGWLTIRIDEWDLPLGRLVTALADGDVVQVYDGSATLEGSEKALQRAARHCLIMAASAARLEL